MGFVPMTIRYARRVYDFDALEKVSATDDLKEKCEHIKNHEPLREVYDSDETVYFSFEEGSKRVEEIVDPDMYMEYMNIRSACEKVLAGKILTRPEFEAMLNDIGIANEVPPEKCDSILKALQTSRVEKVLDGAKMFSPSEVIEKMYPSFYPNLTKTCGN